MSAQLFPLITGKMFADSIRWARSERNDVRERIRAAIAVKFPAGSHPFIKANERRCGACENSTAPISSFPENP